MTQELFDAKVGYIMLSGGTSTAYLDYQDEGVATGVNKYTDEPVTVKWDDTVWREIESGT